MKLIKISADHYIIVDDSEIKEGDYYWNELDKAVRVNNTVNHPYHKKITHTTEPIESVPLYKMPNGELIDEIWYDKIQQLSLLEVKELIGEVDVEKKSYTFSKEIGGTREQRLAYIDGYREALEDNKDRKYTEEDMRVSIRLATTSKYDHRLEFYSEADILQSLQPTTSWDVTFVDGKLKLI